MFMRLVASFIITLVYLFSLVNYSYWADAPLNLKVENIWSDFVDISWKEVDWASGYQVYYSTTEGQENIEEFIWELYTDTVWTVSWLEKWIKYYLALTTVDWEGAESSYSEIVSFTTENKELTSESFALEWIEVIDADVIKLNFNSVLENNDDSVREFVVTNRDDSLDELQIENIEYSSDESMSIYLDFSTMPTRDVEYEVTVIEIFDEQWRNIESWLDASDVFVVSADFVSVDEQIEQEWEEEDSFVEPEVEEDNQQDNQDNSSSSEEEDVDWGLNAAWSEDETNDSTEENNNSEDFEVKENVESVAHDNDKLPQTWPEQLFILALAMLLWFILFRFRKS